ncbi:MAG: hypothetical protein JST14_06130 [Bacteroidetes bacterium]|nr:hypothetical protein [Bacteroidota bacterium]MBS1979307.1 hypothetical protein [Bacteroidota bacterium]
MSYYQTINGKTLDGSLLDMADNAIKGAGDGRISKADAEKLLAAILYDNAYSDVERETVEYLYGHYKWTEAAEKWFKSELETFQKKGENLVKMTPAEIAKQKFPKYDVLTTEMARASRMVDLKAATAETHQDHEDIGIIVRLESGERAEVFSNLITLQGHLVELKGGHAIPFSAIEKVEI